MYINDDLANKLKEKFNPEGSNLRLAQMRMLKMLKFIDKICEEYKITYWLDGGTLLGAIRHKGYIPWDDDTDICMPLKDAEKFKRIMLEKYDNLDYVLQCKETDKGYFGSWYVLRDKKSEYIQDSELHKKRMYRGLQVDIFIAEDKVIEPLWRFTLLYQKVIDKILFKTKSLKKASFFATPLYHFMHSIMLPLFRLISRKNSYYKMPYGSIWNYRLEKKTIYPLVKYAFEDSNFYIPNDFNNYLKREFGNWEEIPHNIWTHQADIRLL